MSKIRSARSGVLEAMIITRLFIEIIESQL